MLIIHILQHNNWQVSVVMVNNEQNSIKYQIINTIIMIKYFKKLLKIYRQ